MNFFIILLLSLFSSFSFRIEAQTYYVSQEGNDKNQGMLWNDSWLTLAYASSQLLPGDVLVIRKGERAYKYLPIIKSGTKKHPITIKGESVNEPPIITGAVIEKNLELLSGEIWFSKTTAEPTIVVEDEVLLTKASTKKCDDGRWFWENNFFYYKLNVGNISDHVIWRSSMGNAVDIRDHSWINIENIHCWLGKGACISIHKGSHNNIRNIYSKWYARGVQIKGGFNNRVENCFVEQNREGIYLLNGASYNTVKNCKAFYNGNAPLWTKGDRAGIAVGNEGPQYNNSLIDNEVAFNGGYNSDPALIVYRSPNSLIKGNYIHDNYGSGMYITIGSDGSIARNNKVFNNGYKAFIDKHKNISGLSVRRSKNIIVENNQIKNNFVAKDKKKNVDVGPRAGLDLRGNMGDSMFDIHFINNVVCGTLNGPNVYISDVPEIDGFYITPGVESYDNYDKCDEE